MLLDKQNLFSDAQSLAVAAGNTLSTNTIDLGTVGTIPLGLTVKRDIGAGEPLQVVVQVVTTFAGGTSCEFQLVHADNAALSSNLEVLQSSGAIAEASLVAGYQAKLTAFPTGTTKQYLGVRYVTLGTHTAGAVTAGVVLDRQNL